MPRLRVTAALSLFALAAGVLGTQWLSGLAAGWAGPPVWRGAPLIRPAARMAVAGHAHRRLRSPMAVAAVQHAPLRVVGAMDDAVAQPSFVPVASPELVPLEMPSAPTAYAALRGHLDGRVVLHVAVDGDGRVVAASVARSSGDGVLDAHALETVRGWRFAVPAGYARGFEGELPMRFDSGTSLAQVR